MDRIRRGHHTHWNTKNRTPSKEYTAWRAMKSRCLNPKGGYFYCYGGRGIGICDVWKNSFERFLSDMGLAPSNKHSIGRIDNNGNYEPSNCRWETQSEQQNNKRNSKIITFNGVSLNVKQWSEKTGMLYCVLYSRIRLGWSIKRAFEQPVKARTNFH